MEPLIITFLNTFKHFLINIFIFVLKYPKNYLCRTARKSIMRHNPLNLQLLI